ncbi:hypothetical protein TNCV_3897451 [Trichonephila clavipes]|nr:hypothetical protein TNCV_3897451 [Trichonephila clavipes]
MSIVLLKNGSWEPLHEWQHMWLQNVMDIPLGCHVCVWCHGSILGGPCIVGNDTYTITPAVEVMCRCKAKAGLRRSPRGRSPHTNTTVIWIRR